MTLKNLFVAFLAVGLVACSSSTGADEEEFEQYEVGTFLVTSPTTAEYVGETSQSKSHAMAGDTLIVSDPENKSLTIEKDTSLNRAAFELTFVDSSFTNEDDIYLPNTVSDLPGGKDSPFTPSAGSNGTRVDHITFSRTFGYKCGEPVSEEDMMGIDYFTRDTTHVTSYRFPFYGFEQTLQDIVC